MGKGRKSLYKNLFTIGYYSYSYTIIQFLASMVISRLLTPMEYGIVAMITVFTGFISYFKDAGISYVIIREDYGRQFHQKVQALTFLVGFLLFLIVALLSFPISVFYGRSELFIPTIVVAFVLFIETVSIVPVALLKKNLQFRQVGKTYFLGYVSGSIATIFFAYIGLSYWSLVFGQLLSVIIIYFKAQSYIHIYMGPFNKVAIISAWNKTKSVIYSISGSRFIQYWSSNADNLIIGKWFGASSLGLYSRAYQLLTMQLNLISGIFNTILLPSLKEDKRKGNDVLERSYEDALSFMSLIIYPITFTLVLFPEELVTIIWGHDWRGVAKYAPYFGILSMTYILSRTFGNIYVLYNKEQLLFKIGIFSATISLGAILLGAYFGIVEIAAFISFAFVAIILPFNIFIAFYKNFKFPANKLLLFWLPKIVISLVVITGLFMNNKFIAEVGIYCLALHVLIMGRSHILKLIGFKRK